MELPRTVSPRIVLQVGVRIHVFPKEIRVHQCYPMISAICVLEDVSKTSRHSLWLRNFEQPWSILHFLPGYRRILHRQLVHRNLEVEQWNPLLLRPSFVMQMSPVQWILRRLRSRPSQCLLEAKHVPCTSPIMAPTPHSLDDRYPSMK